MMFQDLGKTMMVIGALITLVGLIIWLGGSKFSWFGDLPGDIKIEKKDFKFYMPLTSMILLSILLSLLVWIYQKFIK